MRLRFWRFAPFVWLPYPPLFAIYVALVAVILGKGAGIGAPSLIWHDSLLTQLAAGLAAWLLCAQLCFVGYLIDGHENADAVAEADTIFGLAPHTTPDTMGGLARYALVPCAALLFVLFVGAALQAKTRLHGVVVLVGPLAAFLGLVAVARARSEVTLTNAIPLARRPWVAKLVSAMWSRLPAQPAGALDRESHTAQLTFMFGLLAFYVVWGLLQLFAPFDLVPPAALSICFGLSLVVGFWGFLRFWYRRYRLVAGALAILGLAAIGTDSKFGVSRVTFPTNFTRPSGAVDDAAALESWRARQREAKPPLVVVATSGGALRAAIWTVNVLGALEGRHEGFVDHVRLVTGASGGMVGAGYLVSALQQRGDKGAPLDAPWFDRIIEDVAKDSLTPLAHALVFPFEDRGRALERTWERNTRGRMGMPFRDLGPGEAAGWLPSLVYAPMMVEDGRRLLVSNLDLTDVTASFPVPGGPSVSSVQLFACGGDGIDAIKLSTIARLNATFPWVTSAGRLDSEPDRRVVDAGYYDDYGVDLASAWIRKNLAWLEEKTSGVLLLQIRDGKTDEANVKAKGGPGLASRLASPLTTPVEAFLSAREASMLFRNEQKVEVLKEQLVTAPPDKPEMWFFRTVVFEFPGDAPLEWYLNRETIDGLKRAPPGSALDAVETWWKPRAPARR